ncbi:MAG: putative Transposon Ty3-G Gag-Pol polyprotein [Streblomastix strix]|uniref:Putative Transposon Ty3-G Gag-Pol polyprotein n=1 Tax=Streblomastix strix TaxID=222440 RepID=A0A5J4VNR9_9EUKA|nr:MAG: putative Transposon Ty3-G Gag-Pol polyprotein [Streblomastix strix]
MLMQVWRHQQGEQLPETPPQRSQTPIYQQQPGGKLMRYITAWEIINCKDFLHKGFYLIFKDNNSQERLLQAIAQCPLQCNQTEMLAYKAMLQEELQNGIIEEIPKEQVKWQNPTFLVPKPSGEWRKILDASLLNEEIQLLHFQMNGVEQVRYLLIPNDWTVTLDLKSAFHHLIVYPPHRVYLAFEIDNHHYQYRAMTFGCKHSPIFFTQALTLLLTEIRKRTDIRIINYSDDLLLLNLDKNWLFYQTQHIINTLEHFGWTIALNKCQLIPKYEIDFLGWTWNMTEMNIFMTKNRRHKLIDQVKQFIKKNIETQNNQDQRNNSSNRKIEFLEDPIQRSITLSNANRLSQNKSSQNTRLDWNDGLTARSPEGTLFVDQENSREQEIIDIRPNSTSNSSNRCLTPRVGGNTRIRFWRSSSSTRSMAKLPDTLDKQQERTAGHSLRNNSFRKSLQRAANNQSPNQIRQLYSSIRFKKVESNRHVSTSREGDLPHLPTTENKNNNKTRIGKNKHNSRCSQQIVQVRRLSPSHIISRSNKNDLEHPTNSRSIRIINNQATSSIRDSEHKRLLSPMDRRILLHMDQRDPIGTPSNPIFVNSNLIPQQ